jgi:hypothetical protein
MGKGQFSTLETKQLRIFSVWFYVSRGREFLQISLRCKNMESLLSYSAFQNVLLDLVQS